MANTRARRGYYGFDAPNVVRNLAIVGMVYLIAGVASFYTFHGC